MRKATTLLFLTHVITRVIYCALQGFSEHYTLQPDAVWLVEQANEILGGNYSLDIGRFIASPLYPYLVAGFKLIFSAQWEIALMLFQIMLAALSGVYLYKLTAMIFRNRDLALLASLLYAVFPTTLWYVHTFSQESVFQSLLILSLYYLVKSIYHPSLGDVVKSSVLFSLAYLTKSHILLFSLFIPLIFFHRYGWKTESWIRTMIYAGVALLFSLPFGLYQLFAGNGYVISSNGAAYQFYLGNTQAGYVSIVDVPDRASADYKKMKDINYTAGYFNGSEARYDSIMQLPQPSKQEAFREEALNWIGAHPQQFWTMKAYDLGFFLFPGVSHRHYPFLPWLVSFLLALPVYLGAYFSLWNLMRRDFAFHSWIFYLFLSMLLFSVIWYVQNRFRSISLEAIYLMLAAHAAYFRLPVWPALSGRLKKISEIFHGV